MGVQLDAGEILQLLPVGGDGGGADPKERIQQPSGRAFSVEPDALLYQRDRKGRRVGPVLVAGVDGFVGDEPRISPAAQVCTARVAPAGDVGLILVGDARRAAVEWDIASFREVEDVFVAVVDEAFRVDGLKMSGTDGLAAASLDGDGFHPVEGVLEGEERRRSIGECEDELVRHQRICRGSADVEKKRGVVYHYAFHLGRPLAAPSEELLARGGVLEALVGDSEIVRR